MLNGNIYLFPLLIKLFILKEPLKTEGFLTKIK